MKMLYHKPANEWIEGLLQGNGRLGAVSMGGTASERFALNEDTLWSGYPRDYVKPDSFAHTCKARELLSRGEKHAAEKELEEHLLGEFTENYEPLGNLRLHLSSIDENACDDYSRTLNLTSGVAETKFTCGGVRYSRTSFVSHPHQLICVKMTADKPVLNAEITLDSLLRNRVEIVGGRLVMHTRCPSSSLPSYYDTSENAVSYDDAPEKQGISATTVVSVDGDGEITAENDKLIIKNAEWFELRVACRTNFEGFDKFPGLSKIDTLALAEKDLTAAEKLSFNELLNAHIDDFSELMNRQSIELDGISQDDLPTDERLYRYAQGKHDCTLPILLYQFGRYLLISGSRSGTQPLNLQGIWNEKMQAPWSSNYTLNINTEMNYWPAEICGLPEVHEPLFDLLDRLSVTGAKTAKELFNARGAVTNHNTDLWGLSTPVGMHGDGAVVYGWWPLAYAWLSGHLFEHYIYTDDLEFLKTRALPIMRNAAQFFIDSVTVSSKGYYTLSPATSPENGYKYEGKYTAVAEHSTMTDEIMREVLTNYLTAIDRLGADEPDAADARRVLNGLSPLRIGTDGRLLEWDDEYVEMEPKHRHLSHLCGVFPGHHITEDSESGVVNAVKKSLEVRGDAGTGWSLGWKLNLWARLRDGDHALKLLKMQLNPVSADVKLGQGGGSYTSLLCAHPPFQIDGNFAAASGVPRLLIDSALDEITVLPALPTEWTSLKAKGLSGANGYKIDLEVKNGELVHLRVVAGSERATTLRYGEKAVTVLMKKGEELIDPSELID